MPQVDFYNLPTSSMNECLLFSCKLINKAWQKLDSIYIHCQNTEQRQQLNQLLWAFKADSFIPHDLLEENSKSPLLLGLETLDYQSVNAPLLINLSFDIPTHYQHFDRIAEFVIDHAPLKEQARTNYRRYHSANCKIQYHHLQKI